jgi:hypothetical protein
MSFELIFPFVRPIEPLLLDESISEIMGDPDASWCYERDGIIHREKTISVAAGKLQTSRSPLHFSRPCAGDGTNSAEDDCSAKDCLIQ